MILLPPPVSLWLLSLLLLTTRVGICLGGPHDDKWAMHARSVRNNWTQYRHMADVEAVTSREVELNDALQKYRGVYKDNAINQRLGLSNTVILIVQLVQKQAYNNRPKMSLLNNMICHLERLGLKSVLYLSRYLFNNSDVPVHSHFVPNENVVYAPYPDHSFWSMLVTQGKTATTPSKQVARLPYPNFKEYGDKVVLFAVLELLKANLNVILLDDDVMLLRDPIPFLISSHITADIVTPEDTRQCMFLANPLLDVSKWRHLQPEINIGVTFIRSRLQTIQLVKRWMNLVELNGQKAFSPFRRIILTDNSCHTRRRNSFSDSSNLKVFGVNSSASSAAAAPLTICYLSNTLFQNGFMNSHRCGKYNKNPVYLLTISEEVLSLRNFFSPRNLIAKVTIRLACFQH
jgi:hypothetical protein